MYKYFFFGDSSDTFCNDKPSSSFEGPNKYSKYYLLMDIDIDFSNLRPDEKPEEV